jgi:hypothetical protein
MSAFSVSSTTDEGTSLVPSLVSFFLKQVLFCFFYVSFVLRVCRYDSEKPVMSLSARYSPLCRAVVIRSC